jgi:hypothetical protein
MSKWTKEQLIDQCKKLDAPNTLYIYSMHVFPDCGLSIYVGGELYGRLSAGHKTIDTFMASSKLDKELLFVLLSILHVDTEPAMEMCLS